MVGTPGGQSDLSAQVQRHEMRLTGLQSRLEEESSKVRALEIKLNQLHSIMQTALPAQRPAPASTGVTSAAIPTPQAEIRRLNEELAGMRAQLEKAQQELATVQARADQSKAELNATQRRLEEAMATSDADQQQTLRMLEVATRDCDHWKQRASTLEEQARQVDERAHQAEKALAGLQKQMDESPLSPWTALLDEIRQSARRVAADLCARRWTERLEPRRAGLESDLERLRQAEPLAADLKDNLLKGLPVDRETLEPIYSTALGLKGALAGAREVLNRALAGQPERHMPVPELPAFAPECTDLMVPVGDDGRIRVNAVAAVAAWQEAVNTALAIYYEQCLHETDAAVATLEQHMGRAAAGQIQEKVMGLHTMIWHGQHGATRAQPLLDLLEHQARSLVEAMGLTVVAPAPGRDYDVYLHVSLGSEPSTEYPSDAVIRVVEPGYKAMNKVLTKAKVIVSGKRG